MQCATSGAFGSRFFGGRALTTLVIQTSSRTSPASASSSPSSLPARPTNGRPSSSSVAPGASPTNMTRAAGFPSPGTIRDAVMHGSKSQPVWATISSRRAVSRSAAMSAADLSHRYGVVVLSVNVSVFEYAPVRSASVALICCLNEIVTDSFDTGAVQLDLLNATCSGSGSVNVPLARYAGDGATDSAASPAVEITFAVVDAVYSFARPGVNAPKLAGVPSVSASVAGTLPPTVPGTVGKKSGSRPTPFPLNSIQLRLPKPFAGAPAAVTARNTKNSRCVPE